MTTTLKIYGNWRLTQCSTLKYFKKGRANMHMSTVYHIEYDNVGVWTAMGRPENFNQIDTGVFNIKTKAEALKEWTQFKRTHVLGGAELKTDLFPLKAV